MQHDQPRREQDHAPVPWAVVGHVTGREETVVVAGVACIKQLGEAVFVVAQVAVDEVDAQVEEHQRQRHRQPLQRGDGRGGGPGQGDAENAVGKDETGVQPWVVMAAYGGAAVGGVISVAEDEEVLLGGDVGGLVVLGTGDGGGGAVWGEGSWGCC